MTLTSLSIGDYFQWNNRLYLLLEDIHDHLEAIQLTNNGKFVKQRYMPSNVQVKFIGINFDEVTEFLKKEDNET